MRTLDAGACVPRTIMFAWRARPPPFGGLCDPSAKVNSVIRVSREGSG